jgi:hypothetical protein
MLPATHKQNTDRLNLIGHWNSLLGQQINWREIEDKMVKSDLNSGKQYGYVIIVRVRREK